MSEEMAVSAPASPWRFLTALDAANPGDQALLKTTRGDELELVRNMILSSKTTLLYAFSGNGKSSLISAGIIPTLRRSGYAVFRTRPRPALSPVTPSQAFKDCILADFWLPQQNGVDAMMASAQAALAGTAPELRSILDPLLAKVNAVLTSGLGTDFQGNEFRSHFRERTWLPLPEFVEEVQQWVGKEVHLLFVLDQFEELFVHFYNTPEMAAFIADLGRIYASTQVKASFLFSMREDWVGSMVELRHEIPSILSNCFKLEPLRASQAAVALHETTKRVGARFETGVAERILRDLSSFYSVLQKQSFAAVHLTPSRMADPYVELPAVQVLMEHLWNLTDPTDPSGMCITMKAYGQVAPEGTENPAGYFLENYLRDFLNGLPRTPGPEESDVENADELKDLRLDLLYLLTDRYAHRRAVSDYTLLAETREICKADVTKIESQQLELGDVEAALKPLIEAKFICRTEGPRGVCRYELAHDFLVRAVVRLWQRLADRRAEERFSYVQSQKHSRARLKGLSGMVLRVRGLLIGESVATILSVWMLPVFWLLTGAYPEETLRNDALLCPLLLTLSGAVFGCWPAALQGLVGAAGIFSLGDFSRGFSSPNAPWSSYMIHLLVINAYLAMGTVAWSADISEENERKLEWKKIAATAFDYAYILILVGSWFQSVVLASSNETRKLALVALLWLVSQCASILWRQASLGNMMFGLRRISEGGAPMLVWLREAIGQATLLAFALINWAILFSLEFSHWSNRVFVCTHLFFLGGFIWVTFRKSASQQLVGRWSRTRVVNRADRVPVMTGGQLETAIASSEAPESAHAAESTKLA